MPWVAALLSSLLGTALSRVLVGAGLSLATFAALTPLVLSALNAFKNAMQGVTGAVLQIILISGLGVALSAIASALITRVAIDAAKVSVQKKK